MGVFDLLKALEYAGALSELSPTPNFPMIGAGIVFQKMILRRLEGGDHTGGVFLRPIMHSKSLSGKL